MTQHFSGASAKTPSDYNAHLLAGQGRIGLMGLLSVQAIVGYEWLVSGLAKLFGNFVPTFGDQLPEFSQNAPAWFRSILDALVVPAPTLWAVVIEVGELLIGVALIGAAALWAWRFDRLPRVAHTLLMVFTGLAAIFASLLAVSLHFLNAASHPWLIPSDAFEEGVDLDSLLPAIQLVFFVVSVRLLHHMRHQRPVATGPDKHENWVDAELGSQHGQADGAVDR